MRLFIMANIWNSNEPPKHPNSESIYMSMNKENNLHDELTFLVGVSNDQSFDSLN